MRPTREQDPYIVDNYDTLSLLAILALASLVLWATAPKPAPKPIVQALPAAVETKPLPKLGTLLVASYYERPYHGRKTASGAIYDMNKMTAAHRTFPFGTRLRLSVGGRSCVVTINDRGPFINGRDLDLSEAAARKLGMIKAGVATVEVTEVRP